MHRLFYLFAALAVSLPVSAQSDLLSDPDIVWIGTFSGDYRLDPTMVTFDVETFEQHMTISQSLPIEERIDAIRFTLRWFYDDRKRRLYYEFVGLAHTKRFFDEKGEVMFSKAMFYMKGGK